MPNVSSNVVSCSCVLSFESSLSCLCASSVCACCYSKRRHNQLMQLFGGSVLGGDLSSPRGETVGTPNRASILTSFCAQCVHQRFICSRSRVEESWIVSRVSAISCSVARKRRNQMLSVGANRVGSSSCVVSAFAASQLVSKQSYSTATAARAAVPAAAMLR